MRSYSETQGDMKDHDWRIIAKSLTVRSGSAFQFDEHIALIPVIQNSAHPMGGGRSHSALIASFGLTDAARTAGTIAANDAADAMHPIAIHTESGSAVPV